MGEERGAFAECLSEPKDSTVVGSSCTLYSL
jgi:hypothetical protein